MSGTGVGVQEAGSTTTCKPLLSSPTKTGQCVFGKRAIRMATRVSSLLARVRWDETITTEEKSVKMAQLVEIVSKAVMRIFQGEGEEGVGVVPLTTSHLTTELRQLTDSMISCFPRLNILEGYTRSFPVTIEGQRVMEMHYAPSVFGCNSEAEVVTYIIQTIVNQLVTHYHAAYKFHELHSRNFDLRATAFTDHLTTIPNRHALNHFFSIISSSIANDIQRAGEYYTMGALMFDIDHFKQVNDIHGHDVGDRVLREIASISRKACQEYFNLDSEACLYGIQGFHPDVSLFRMGGEEFAIFMPNRGIDNLLEFAEQLRSRIEQHQFVIKENRFLQVTCSIGVADSQFLGSSDFNPKKLEKRADISLYNAKRQGRNRVVKFLPGDDTMTIPVVGTGERRAIRSQQV